ncbi:MAG TPA: asparagine synthase-related protein, partial [Gammaproteobacteria bacterium]|nr:asparagine synthase-related protein [Gammaproteobacteria bacterium]
MNIPGVAGRLAPDLTSDHRTRFAEAMESLAPGGDFQTVDTSSALAGIVDGWMLNDGDISCAIAGNVDWMNYELADVQLKRDPAYALLRAYRQYGTDLLRVIGGRFSLALWDGSKRVGLVATDRFGQMPVYWSSISHGDLLFGPTATAVARLTGGRATLSDQGIFNYLYFHMVPAPETAFKGIHKLMAAHALVTRDGKWTPQRYWEPDFREDADTSFADAAEEMIGLLSTSVGRLDDGDTTGAFLSGGLDSSTVAGLLARHRSRPKTYSIGFDAEGFDETGYARIASQRFDTDFQTYYVTPADVLSELPRIAASYDEPFGNSSALPAYFCARLAADDGQTRLLAGDGGDELFAGNERYAKQAVFERYALLPSWSRRLLLEPALHLLPDNSRIVGKARSYTEQANTPLPDRLHTYNFLRRLQAERIINHDFLASIDTELPLQLDRELYHHPKAASRLNRMLYLDWHHTLADNDLRKVNRMCQLAGIEVEYPMLDDRLVELSTRISSTRKMHRNRLRDFYKRAVKGFLPDEIINKQKHGFGLPFGIWMAEDRGLQELAMDNLSRMKRRHYVRAGFIDEIVDLHREQHAGYYGEFIWVLMMLELWLTAQGYEP